MLVPGGSCKPVSVFEIGQRLSDTFDDGAGGTMLVGVDVGMYADGWVEITSTRIEAGMQVVTP